MRTKNILALILCVLAFASCTQRAEGISDPLVLLADGCVGEKADTLLETVKEQGYVVLENSDVTCGQELWKAFFQKCSVGEPASVKIANYHTLNKGGVSSQYYDEHKNNYPIIYLATLTYDGESYVYESHNGLDGTKGYTVEYSHLKRYLSDPPNVSATFIMQESYILVNDPTVSYDRLKFGLLSSQAGDYIPHHTVYSDYTYKEEAKK